MNTSNITQLTTDQFMTIGTRMFGDVRWGAEMARKSGLSQSSVSNAMTGKTISKKTTQTVLDMFASFAKEGSVPNIVQTTAKMTAPAVLKSSGVDTRTDAQILETIRKRFDVTDRVVQGIIRGHINSSVVFGAPGVGKSFNILGALEIAEQAGKHLDVIKGACTAVGLYHALYNARNGGIVVLDDADGVFDDEEALNIMKTALDSSEVRTISWRKMARWVYDPMLVSEEEAEDRLPNNFVFNGAVIFITNKNIKAISKTGSKLAPHMDALVSRSHYIDLRLVTVRERMLRIKDVFMNCGMHESLNLNREDAQSIMDFVVLHSTKMNELSLRALKIMSETFKAETLAGNDWREMAMVTQMDID